MSVVHPGPKLQLTFVDIKVAVCKIAHGPREEEVEVTVGDEVEVVTV